MDNDKEEVVDYINETLTYLTTTHSITSLGTSRFGFDICIDCQDLAPFPSAAHMRAVEEHIGMLDMV